MTGPLDLIPELISCTYLSLIYWNSFVSLQRNKNQLSVWNKWPLTNGFPALSCCIQGVWSSPKHRVNGLLQEEGGSHQKAGLHAALKALLLPQVGDANSPGSITGPVFLGTEFMTRCFKAICIRRSKSEVLLCPCQEVPGSFRAYGQDLVSAVIWGKWLALSCLCLAYVQHHKGEWRGEWLWPLTFFPF